ncbi:MAG TPA: protein kinase [Gemmatimonadaceae bacterium]|nr:protein kinase [Gemmatimonadaceae bacterium]
MADLREQLQSTLGSAYTLERELGGGGMSRVFAATETALGRPVVVKVLSPELAEGVSVERFKREIQLAAQLRHPHIVPLLAAGESAGLPYYTMPLEDGHSLRTRLAKGGPLPITEAIGVLRDVAKALAYAHEHGVVHRDIKPDNVLLTGGSAVVTDFGVAKALAASRNQERGATLTAVGSSLGTPTYMAPEQAAADPDTNHRADIYAFGVMSYELLTGQPPFHGRTPQKLLAAQMTEKPEPIGELRGDVPPLLSELVMKCLEKDPDARPQSAADLVRVLETVTSGGGHPAMPAILLGGRRRLGRALILYALAVVGVAIVARAAIIAIGLPDWVFPGALIVMALGLPVILFTAFVHHGAHQALTHEALTPGGTPMAPSTFTRLAVKASPWVSWRRTALGGVVAVSAFALLVVGFMLLRALGIGPAGSLLAAGKLKEREPVLLDDFRGPPNDSTLGAVVTEAFRTDLSQSDVVTLAEPSRVARVLDLMKRPDAKLDLPLAREVAIRSGIPAVIDGDVNTIGPTYVLSVRLVSADSGRELAAFRESADNAKEVIPAIDRLSKRLRARIGESLRTVQQARPLEDVTTSSFDALTKYVQGVHAREVEGDALKAKKLLLEAIALDTGFAMAYRKLGVVNIADLSLLDEGTAAFKKAMDYSGRLSETERNLTIGSYYGFGAESDPHRALSAYEAVLDVRPTEETALINAAVAYSAIGNHDKAIEYYRRVMAADSFEWVSRANLEYELSEVGKAAERSRLVDETAKLFPSNPISQLDRAFFLAMDGHYDSSASAYRRSQQLNPTNQLVQSFALGTLADIDARQGRYADAERLARATSDIDARRGLASAPLVAEAVPAFNDVWVRNQKERGLRRLDEALAHHPLSSMPPLQRPYPYVATIYALGGRPAQARVVLAEMERAIPAPLRQSQAYDIHTARGEIAFAERRPADAITEFRAAEGSFPSFNGAGCAICPLANLGRAYDLAGNADSTIAIFERYLSSTSNGRMTMDPIYRAGIYKRLGELYDSRGDRDKAIQNYSAFVSLWRNADPELQLKVAEVKRRLQALSQAERH